MTSLTENSTIYYDVNQIESVMNTFTGSTFQSLTTNNLLITDIHNSINNTDLIYEQMHSEKEKVSEMIIYFYNKETYSFIRSIDHDLNLDIHSSLFDRIVINSDFINANSNNNAALLSLDDGNYIIESYFVLPLVLNESQNIGMLLVARNYNSFLYQQFEEFPRDLTEYHPFLQKGILPQNEELITSVKNPYTEIFKDSY